VPLEDEVLRSMQSDAAREWRPRDVHVAFPTKTLVQVQYALKKLVEQGAIVKRTVGRGVLYRVAEASRMPADMHVCSACGGRGTIPVAQLPEERRRRAAAREPAPGEGAEAEIELTPEELVPLEVESIEFVKAGVEGEAVCQRCTRTSYFARLLDDGRLLYCCSRGHQTLLAVAA
jgi:Fe2+ or Zn2+ uptake regulation protein